MSPNQPGTMTSGGDAATLNEQAKRWSDTANANLKRYFLDAYANWQLNSSVQRARGMTVDPMPTPPPAVHYAWVDGYGEVCTVGPDLVCAIPTPPVAATDVNAVDDVVGGPIPNKPDCYYQCANYRPTVGGAIEGETHRSADGRFFVFGGAGFFRCWKELKFQ